MIPLLLSIHAIQIVIEISSGIGLNKGRQLQQQIAILNNSRTPDSQMFCVLVVKEES